MSETNILSEIRSLIESMRNLTPSERKSVVPKIRSACNDLIHLPGTDGNIREKAASLISDVETAALQNKASQNDPDRLHEARISFSKLSLACAVARSA